MAQLILGPMLRYAGDNCATIWVETDSACTVHVLDHQARTFCVEGHYYALVVVTGLAPGTSTPYEVHLDGERCWPREDSSLPPSMIRTLDPDATLRVLSGSCRAAAPHEPPWSLAPDDRNDKSVGRGVDAMRAHGLRMLERPPEEWPNLFVLVGDQVYADDSSPGVRDRIRRRRTSDLPPEIVGGFEEFTWLYHESWKPELERWLFSVVPTTMIFDDHDMIDDWNISISWVRDIRKEPWWRDHVVGGLMSYWIYQHLGNLSPRAIEEEGMLAEFTAVDDAGPLLRRWAEESEEFTPVPGGYRFSYSRDLGGTRLVVIDCRNGRVLDAGDRAMLDENEWAWVVEEACRPCDHLLLATSLPVMVPGGLHDLQSWNEAICNGKWGSIPARLGEKMRRGLDLEDWPAFRRSFDDLVDLVRWIGSATGPCEGSTPPATIELLSGDIHFTYRAEVTYPETDHVTSRVHQVVSSPIRNALSRSQRWALRFGSSRHGRVVGEVLRRAGRIPKPAVSWKVVEGPMFGNCMAALTFDGRECELMVETVQPDDDGQPHFDEILHAQL